MPKLPTIKSQVPTLSPLIGVPTGDRKAWLKQRDENVSWRKWYRSKRWQRLRWQTLTKAMFTCAICGRIEADTSKLVCDHIKPHRGNETLFYDEDNLQCLCKACHDSVKQRLEKQQHKGTITYPDYLLPSLIPLTIVCGAPASGKTHYVMHHTNDGDIVIDLDDIVYSMTGKQSHAWDRGQYFLSALAKRNQMLLGLSQPDAKERYKRAWFIISEPNGLKRSWWKNQLKAESVIVLATPDDQCIANAARDKDRDQSETASAIHNWWNKYTSNNGDTIIEPVQTGTD